MKRGLLILMVFSLLIFAACDSPSTENTTSKCDSYQTSYIKQKCQAVEALDISMCEIIQKSNFREDCILIIAELVQDQEQLPGCELSKFDQYKRTCQALIKKDVGTCLGISENLAESGAREMRDCIELVARKLKDKDICNTFITSANSLKNACGQTKSCEEEWITNAEYHAQDCKQIIN